MGQCSGKPDLTFSIFRRHSLLQEESDQLLPNNPPTAIPTVATAEEPNPSDSNGPPDPYVDPIAAIAAAVEQLLEEAERSNPPSNPPTDREAESEEKEEEKEEEEKEEGSARTKDETDDIDVGNTLDVQSPTRKDEIYYNPTSLWGNTFVDGTIEVIPVGYASFHFEGAAVEGRHQAYYSFEHPGFQIYGLDDGPFRIPFDDISYNEDTKTFRGVLDWEKRYNTTKLSVSARHRYEMIFDDEYTCIKGGTRESIGIDGEVKHTGSFGDKDIYFNASLERTIETKTNLLLESEGGSDDQYPETLLKVNQTLLKRMKEEDIPSRTIGGVCRILGVETVIVPEQYYTEIVDDATRTRRKEAWNNKMFVAGMMKVGKFSLHMVAENLKEDRDVIFAALEGDLSNLRHVSDKVNFNDDEELFEHIVEQTPYHPETIFKWIEEEERSNLLHESVRRNPHIVDFTNEKGKKAVDIAIPKCKQAMEAALYLFSKFKVKKEKPLHQSRTACVLEAKAHSTDDITNTTRKENVALKCMGSVEQVMSEIKGRKGLDPNFVLGIKSVHVDSSFCNDDKYDELIEALKQTDTPIEKVHNLVSEVSTLVKNRKRGDTGETGEEEDVMYNFVLQLDFAERVLETIIKHDRVFENTYMIKMILNDLILALSHLHEKKIIHGDVKPLNIVLQGSRYRVIDMDVSCPIGKPFGSKRPSTGFCPPEVARLLFDGQLEEYEGHESYDMWSVGVLAYRLATNQELFQTDGEDNIVDDQKQELLDWNKDKRDNKLKNVKDPQLKDLLEKILHHDATERTKHFEGGIKSILDDPYFNNSKDFTGLYNQVTFKREQAEWESKAKNSLCAAFAIDVANFKTVNDKFSHGVGDKALVSLANQIKEQSLYLPNSSAYHSGGDEYQILAECGNNEEVQFKEEVMKTAERLSTIKFEKSPVTCFLRMGIVSFIGATYDQADKLEHCVKDEIMKKRGFTAEDRVPVYDSVPEERFIVKFKKDSLE